MSRRGHLALRWTSVIALLHGVRILELMADGRSDWMCCSRTLA